MKDRKIVSDYARRAPTTKRADNDDTEGRQPREQYARLQVAGADQLRGHQLRNATNMKTVGWSARWGSDRRTINARVSADGRIGANQRAPRTGVQGVQNVLGFSVHDPCLLFGKSDLVYYPSNVLITFSQ